MSSTSATPVIPIDDFPGGGRRAHSHVRRVVDATRAARALVDVGESIVRAMLRARQPMIVWRAPVSPADHVSASSPSACAYERSTIRCGPSLYCTHETLAGHSGESRLGAPCSRTTDNDGEP